ncbi:hypothetical protein CBS9595_003474 [Malassezia furfur]|nr:hypothetical protein CBS9595_003474 [Malassezia furfur]
MAARDARGAGLVSFNLLDDRDERRAAPGAFASLFDRMRAAFVTHAERDAAPAMAPPPPRRRPSPERTASQPERVQPQLERVPSQPGRWIMPLRTLPPARAGGSESGSPGSSATSLASVPGTPSATAVPRAASPEAESQLTQIAQSVPGFPLGGDVLDDTHSLASVPHTRSEVGDDTMSTLTFRPAYPSADAWIRRFRGEGLSRKYWMADETAKECRDCLLPFTPLRRRHHCRICGQIFCHKCCSNIVPGARFGHADAIRTCNQCLRMLQEYDRREAIDSEHRAAASARADDVSSIAPLSPTEPDVDDLHTPQSQFAATTLFSRDAHALPWRVPRDDGDAWDASWDVDEAPDAGDAGDVPGADGAPEALTPFRAGLDADDAASPAPLTDASFDEPGPVVADEPEHAESEYDAGSPTTPREAPGSPVRRTARQKLMRGASRFVTSTALGAPSLVFFLRMLHQVLVAEHVGDVQEWKETVKLLALAVIERVRMRTRSTYLTDIRNFVKIKCMPGGRISDCEFLDGYICTKNVATKRMASFLPVRNARIMVIAFPLEYHRNANQLMSLEPIMAQEHEFLRILVARILALRPNVVVAEKSVSYYALQLFEEAHVAVFWPMKRSSIDIIARCTQADVVSSIDRLALEPRLGRCACLSVDTYAFAHEPGRRKPLLRIEVVSKDVSSALVLRGAPIDKLRRIKAILALMVFVGHNLKLEEFVRRDLGVSLDWSVMNIQHGPEDAPGSAAADADEETHRSHLLTETLRKYHRLILSASISVILPPPFLVTHMKQVTDRLHALRSALPAEKHDVLVYELQGRAKDADSTLDTDEPSAKEPRPQGVLRSRTTTPAALPAPEPSDAAAPAPTPATEAPAADTPAPTERAEAPAADTPAAPTSPVLSAAASTSRDDGPDDEAVSHITLQDPRSFAEDTELTVLDAERSAMQHSWKACVSNMAKMLTPFAHQRLVALVSTTCAVTLETCTGPALHTIEYYGVDDEPLGHLLERTVDESANICPAKGCDRANLLHYTTYQHNEMRVQMVVERFACPLPGEEKHLLCWSYCKTCGRTTPVAHLSDEAWSFSFAKYLELQFYPNHACHPSTCQHDYYRDSVRYFALRNLAIRFHADWVQPCEVVVPPMHLLVYEDRQYALKNEETISLFERNAHYWDSVHARLAALQRELRTAPIYTASPSLSKVQTQALRLLRRIAAAAQADGAEVQRLIVQLYWDSGHDLLRLNDARRVLQDKVVEWDGLFLEFEKHSSVSERELRRLLASYAKHDTDDAAGDTASERPPRSETPSADLKRSSLDVSNLSLWDMFGSRDERDKTRAPEKRDGDKDADADAADEKASTHDATTQETPAPAPEGGDAPAPEGGDAPPDGPPAPPAADDTQAPPDGAPAHGPPQSPASDAPKLLPPFDPPCDVRPAPASAPPSPEHEARPPSPASAPTLAVPCPVRPRAVRPHDVRMRPPSTEPGTVRTPMSPTAVLSPGSASPDPGRTPKRSAPSPAHRLTLPPNNQSFASLVHHRPDNITLRPPWETQQPSAPARPRAARKDDKRISRSQVSSMTRHFDMLSREAERARERQRERTRRAPSRTRRARPVTATNATVEVFKNLRDAVGADDDESDSEREEAGRAARTAPAPPPVSAGAGAGAEAETEAAPAAVPTPPVRTPSATTPGEPRLAAEALAVAKEPEFPHAASRTAPPGATRTDDAHAPRAAPPESAAEMAARTSETAALFAQLGDAWTLHCGELAPLVYPFLSTDHVFSDSRVVVREDEPSSLIAFTLHSKAYREQLRAAQQARARAEGAVPPADEQSSAEHLRDLENELRTTEGTHLGYEFDTGNVKMWCKIFFAEQFDALRHMYGCADTIVQSLSRCYKWDAGAGKSGSAFLKTRDDRLMVKQLSRAEMDGFSKFAPQYFAYVADCKVADRPTTLTKIFGYFRIGFRNAHTGKSLKLDVVVMENLVYGHDVYKIFDLKGSTRNRLRQETGREYEVLLDENLVRMSRTSPILVREYSKRILRAALYNDSLFLTDMNVMDYSLIVVLDAKRNELVIGIIDYLRTYTWDKRVESFVKETAILGGGGKGEPTIITPRQYRMRFLTFLDRYFWMTPDPWVPAGWVL